MLRNLSRICADDWAMLPASPWRIRSVLDDVIAFPVGDRGAHQLLNASDKPCKLFLLGMDEAEDVCHYPDSDKVSMAGRRLRVRASPHLDYYDREL